jgi:hypothetical protein
MHLLVFFAILSFAFSFYSEAQAATCDPNNPVGTVCLELPCATLGSTKLDGDSKNILACLKNNSGGLVWKSMSAGGPPPGLIYQAGMYTTGGGCVGTNGCRWPNPLTGGCSCPSGYTPHQFWEFQSPSGNGYYKDGCNIYQNIFVKIWQCLQP